MPRRAKETKTARLELRLTPSAASVIQQAVDRLGLTLGDLTLRGAQSALDEHERLVLRGADREAFLRAVGQPPKPTARLKEAFRAHSERTKP